MSMATVEVKFLDTTMRDGAQALHESNQFDDNDKPSIANNIAALGIETIEAGFPATPEDAERVNAVAEIIGNKPFTSQTWFMGEFTGEVIRPPVITGLSRAKPSDIEKTWDAVKAAERTGIHTFVASADDHMKAKFPGHNKDSIVRMAVVAVQLARQISRPDTVVEFSAEAASSTDMLFLERIVKDTIQAGADIINVPDTLGKFSTRQAYAFYRQVIGWVMSENTSVVISAHNHDDGGLAVANSLELVSAAADYAQQNQCVVKVQIEGTVSGLGERAGNAALEQVAYNLFQHPDDTATDIQFNFNPSAAVPMIRTILNYAGLEIPRQAPVIGSDTLTHRSGIHSDGLIKGGYAIYTPHDPRFWGHEFTGVIEDGSYQGAKGRNNLGALVQ